MTDDVTFSKLQHGRLMQIQPDPKSRFTFKIWFDYTRKLFNDIKEGDLVGVESFGEDSDGGSIYSILKIVQKIPHHYALPEDLGGYPGFLTEAAKSVSESWISQYQESDEELTKIVCEAVPTGVSIIENPKDPARIDKDRSLPMVGEEAKVVSENTLSRIINMDIGNKPGKPTVIMGTHVGHDEVEILLDPIAAMNKHFGIFGFTGAGKSNLLSTFVAYSSINQSEEDTKFVVFDVNDEYTTLLVDILSRKDMTCYIVACDANVFPDSIKRYYETNNADELDTAAQNLLDQLYIPSAMIPLKQSFLNPLKELLKRKVFRNFQEDIAGHTIGSILEKANSSIYTTSKWWKKVESSLYRYWNTELTPQIMKQVALLFSGQTTVPDPTQMSLVDTTTDKSERISAHESNIVSNLQKVNFEFSSSMQKSDARKIGTYLEFLLEEETRVKKEDLISMDEILSAINEPNSSSLVIVVGHRNRSLRRFSYTLGQAIYQYRNSHPKKYPQVSFVIDEADEFIPQEKRGQDDSYDVSREIAETIARRGRKYNIGLGISTQRIIYLDTTILSQMQTYFVSKLPRRSDRDRISDAFMLSDAEFEQTHAFEVGEWLLASHHEATGQKNLPMPIRVEDANERIKRFLQE